ncbi:MAG: nucleotidyltransferase family protein, partial [Acidobacteriota bacterium]
TKHGAENVRVFGSMARGDARADSDLALLVDVGPRRTPFFPGGLVADPEDLLGRKVDVSTEAGIHRSLRARILDEAIPL